MQDNFKPFHKEVTALYELYKEAQLAVAVAEEFTGKYPLGVVNEFKGAFHHLMEAFASFESSPGAEVWRDEFKKGMEEHLVRAIFDAYNLSIEELQKNIRQKMGSFKVVDVLHVFPEYFKTIEPYFVDVAEQLAAARVNRKGSTSLDLFKGVLITTKQYKKLVDNHLPILGKYVRQERKKKITYWILTGSIALIVAISAAYYTNKEKIGPVPQIQQTQIPPSKK